MRTRPFRSCEVCGYLVEDHDISSVSRACSALARRRSLAIREEYFVRNDYDTYPDTDPLEPEA